MAHYAIISDQNIVEQVIVGKNEHEALEGQSHTDWEAFYSELFGKTVKQTSINTYHGKHLQGKIPFRLNYASPGMRYDPVLDAFVYTVKAFPSWVFDDSIGDFRAPVDIPNDGKSYDWDESTLSWVESEID